MSDPLASVRAEGKDHAQTATASSHGDDALEGLLRLIRAAGTEAQGSGLRLAQGRSQRSQAALVHSSSTSASGVDAVPRAIRCSQADLAHETGASASDMGAAAARLITTSLTFFLARSTWR